MSLLSKHNLTDTVSYPCLNTTTLMDVALSDYQMGTDKNWYLDGGLAPMSAFSGKGGTFKSTVADSLITKIIEIYPGVECIKLDTENNSFGKKRFENMSNEEVTKSIVLKKSSEMSQKEFLQLVDTIANDKIKNKKDYIVETPFINPVTNKALTMLIPTIIDIDSFTLFRPDIEIDNDLSTASDSSRNMDDMTDGRVKRKILMQFQSLAAKAGLYFVFIAQIGNNTSLNPMMQPAKQLPSMKHTERLKGVSDMFTYLTNTLIQFMGVQPLLTQDKKEEWYRQDAAYNDLHLVTAEIIRCKSSGSGLSIPLVVSQSKGVSQGLNYYNMLTSKKCGDFGLEKKGHNRYTRLIPDVALHRNSIIELLNNNYELSRALEIITHFYWISTHWNLCNFPVKLPRTIEEFYDLLDSDNSKKSEILNSRGYWTYNKKDPRKYMGLIEIVNLLMKK